MMHNHQPAIKKLFYPNQQNVKHIEVFAFQQIDVLCAPFADIFTVHQQNKLPNTQITLNKIKHLFFRVIIQKRF